MSWWASLWACAHDWCGPGTVEVDRSCLAVEEAPEAPLTCGDGTAMRDGECVPSVRCGPGTVELDGECVVQEAALDCGPGTVVRGDVCVGLDRQFVHVPFPEGAEIGITQGNHGYFSHGGYAAYALDWKVPEGTVVVAARAGRVLDLREDSDSGCGEVSCADQANFLVLDHGDGSFGQYWHLQQDGALVEVGEIVGRGQPIALSGNTGWSTGPHLHFQVRDTLDQSLPLYFEDQPDTDGAVFAGAVFRSGNAPLAAPSDLAWSTCPEDLFAFLGVRLEPGVPCARLEGNRLGPVGGEAMGGARAFIGAWASAVDEWRYHCSEGTTLAEDLQLSSELYVGHTWLVIGAATQDCGTFQGWDTSVPLILAP
jgi:hypothetical protein